MMAYFFTTITSDCWTLKIKMLEGQMKKLVGSLFIILSFVVLSGCTSGVTVNDLQANDWTVKGFEDRAGNKMIASFSDDVITFTIDSSEASIKDTADEFVREMAFEINYRLEKDRMTWEDPAGVSEEVKYKVSREDSNIVLTPDEENKEHEEMILIPHTSKDTDDSK